MKTKEILKKIHSIKLCMMAHPDNEPDSEFEDRINDLDEIENVFQAIDSKIDKLPKMSFEEAEKESKCCDYAIDAVEIADDNGVENEINWADAASFFLEGYDYARKMEVK